MSVVIETINLTKVYEGALKSQDVRALTNLNLAIHSGEIFGYLGPNGSGKTTTIKLLLGLLFPTEGSMRIFGRTDIGAPGVRRRIGYLPEGAYYPDFLRGEEVLSFYGRLYGLRGGDLKRRVNAVLDTVGMERTRKRLVRGYSKGMRQRIGMAQALLSDPDILILDEPTTGLDPIARKEIRDILARLRDAGKSLLISSHELLEVELISDRIGILKEGELRAYGTLGELLTQREVVLRVGGADAASLGRLAESGLQVEDRVENAAALRVPEGMDVYAALERCKRENLNLISIAPRRETLEELFVRVIGGTQATEKGNAA